MIAALTLAMILVLLASGLWIAVSLGMAGTILFVFLLGGGQISCVGAVLFNTLNSFTYVPIPLFMFMGEIIFYSGMTKGLYRAADSVIGFFPGGLLTTNIASCSIFAAMSGSAMATLGAIGPVAYPELEQRGYSRTQTGRRLLFGSLASGSTLGPLIPPSTIMIVYGGFVDESIGRLFMAGVFPGLVLAALFITYIGVTSLLHSEEVPQRGKLSLRAIASSTSGMLPPTVLIFLVIGSIYLGVATVTEAAALGAAGALVFCALSRRLTWQVIWNSGIAALKITSWCMFIVIGATFMAMSLSFLGVPMALAAVVGGLELPRWVLFINIVHRNEKVV